MNKHNKFLMTTSYSVSEISRIIQSLLQINSSSVKKEGREKSFLGKSYCIKHNTHDIIAAFIVLVL